MKKTVLTPWRKPPWWLPEVGAAFVAALADVLEVYAEPYEPPRPQVNVEATNTPLRKETRLPLPAQPGRPQRFDDA